MVILSDGKFFGIFLVHPNYGHLIPSGLNCIPLFLRLGTLELKYFTGKKPIEEKCEFIEKSLIQLRTMFDEHTMLKFNANISSDSSDFRDHSQVVERINNHILPLCIQTRAFYFNIEFESDKNSITTLISKLLHLEQIKCCSKLIFSIDTEDQLKLNLPIEDVSAWLEKKAYLEFNQWFGIQNFHEMIEYLKQVILH